jgi:hypothetical protein
MVKHIPSREQAEVAANTKRLHLPMTESSFGKGASIGQHNVRDREQREQKAQLEENAVKNQGRSYEASDQLVTVRELIINQLQQH